MRPKGAKGAVHQPPDYKWAHLSQFLTPKPNQTQMAKTHLRTQVGRKSVHGLWQPSEATRSALSRDSTPVQGKTSLPSMHSVLKDQEWCIYGITYHCAPFVLRNPMVTLSGPNYVIPNEVPTSKTIFKGGLFRYLVWQFPGGYQKTI
ncbi:hypothetical protein O181_024024 [Austropuccinia psidii MF-1]|uniref:Uncharacterized protein n=1 Tax=Austropuccinia psidii MF-1 TaxID=1389203 RepID=A0A9Q3CHU4_9BASI|nr:hypothetical protein [Austropuccinia psidii MF-1]